MIGSNRAGGQTPSNYRKRVFSREKIPFKPNSFNIDLGQPNVGRVLNLSEGGLGVQADTNSIGGLIPQIRFKFSRSEVWIETGGRVIWSDPSGESAGIEFIGLPEEGQNQIKEWLAEARTLDSGAAAQNALQLIQSTKLADPLPVPALQAPAYSPARAAETIAIADPLSKSASTVMVFRDEEKTGNHRSRLVIGLCVAILFVGGLIVFRPRHLGSKAQPPQPVVQDNAAAEEIRPPFDKTDPTDPPAAAAAAPAKPITPPQQLSGFVLQAGAMAIEKNANVLADTLRQQNFHVFLKNSGADHLFRVYVGPFPDRDSALKTKTSLERQGIPSILKSWTPPVKPEISQITRPPNQTIDPAF